MSLARTGFGLNRIPAGRSFEAHDQIRWFAFRLDVGYIQRELQPFLAEAMMRVLNQPRGRTSRRRAATTLPMLGRNRQGLTGAATLSLPPVVQAKLRIGSPNDKYEQEADRVADAVMRMPDATARSPQSSSSIDERIQRLCPECEEELRRQPEEEEEKKEELLQTKASTSRVPMDTASLASNTHSIRGGGQPLPEAARDFFEPRFGRDFSGVRVHAGTDAVEAARAIHARAFTIGQDIVFGANEYHPDSNRGRELMAHELTHVMQQTGTTARAASIPDKIQRRSILFGAGEVRFNGCSSADLSDFAVIPEDGTTTFTPSGSGVHETDGFWWRHHSPKTEWFKIPDDCLVDVTCTAKGFDWTRDCTFSTPGWTSTPHGSTNPF